MSEEKETREEERIREVEKSLLDRGWDKVVMERGPVVYIAPLPTEEELEQPQRKRKCINRKSILHTIDSRKISGVFYTRSPLSPSV